MSASLLDAIPFMLVGPLLAAVCVGIYVTTSFLTPAMDPRQVAAVCWDHPLAFLRGRLEGRATRASSRSCCWRWSARSIAGCARGCSELR